MVCKMHEIIDFPSFFEKVKAQSLPIKTSYRLMLLASEIEKHINFYQESFNNILMEYGQKDEKGNFISTDDGRGIKIIQNKVDECNEKVAELRDLDIELPDITFSIDDFGDIVLTPMEVYIIKHFIKNNDNLD